MPSTRRTTTGLLTIVTALSLAGQHTAQAVPVSSLETLNLAAMAESASWAAEALRRTRQFSGWGAPLDFRGSYSADGFSSTTTGVVSGQPFAMGYSGQVTSVGETAFQLDISMNGHIGGQRFGSSGSMQWHYDADRHAYAGTRSELIRFGSDSFAGRAGEEQARVPLLPAIAIGVVIYFWLTSTAEGEGSSDTTIDYDTTPPSSETGTGTVDVDDDSVSNEVDGTESLDASVDDGSVVGTLTPVPEPASAVLSLLGLGALLGTRHWRRRTATRA
ncbi:PEP-CTERM sorting domain-containing protein [Eleftheria terrae]|uniref:PEP-CTERM sorting domain-containing protein n=1 Tax=Eleftheria terrae TaxID=1597781 RepID=UPI00263B31FA|nr:PEP-CTERM sorting domain-containing protein [Eleftheria terrae]WKB55567.1 PEP-CTERM sorting domain-containing protein [Eleftheria terrae]